MEKEKDEKVIKKSKLRQHIELMEQYFDVDNENKIVTVHVHFDSVEQLFNNYRVVKSGKKPLISNEVSEKLEQILERIPKRYKLNLEISIDDYNQFSKEQLKQIVYENLLMKKFSYRIKIQKNYHQAFILGGIGVLFLVLNIVGQFLHWFGPIDGIFNLIMSKFIDIAAWVFIWEAVTISLLESTEHRGLLKALDKKINDIIFIDE